MSEGWRPRVVTPRLRSGAAAESARLQRCRNGQEELPLIRGQGRPGGDTTVRGQGRQPGGPTLGAVAAWVQEALEELSHREGQEGRR